MQKINSINEPKILLELSRIAFKNAKELYFEARILYFFRRFARSLFLAQIGGEEIGKHILCASSYSLLRAGQFNLKNFNKRIYNHVDKTMLINFMEDIFLNLGVKSFSDRKNEAELLEQGKLFGLYTDIFEDNYLLLPSKVITRQMARESVKWLKNRLKLFGRTNILKNANSFERISDDEFKKAINKLFEKHFPELIKTDKDFLNNDSKNGV